MIRATAAGAADEGELTTTGRRDDGVAAGAAEAVGELAAVGTDAAGIGAACAGAAPLSGPPRLGSTTVNTMAATAAATTTKSVMAPAIIPVRKLTSSSWALMAARTPGPVPAAL